MLLQLRQRSRSGGSGGDYARVNSDDYDEDDAPFHTIQLKAPVPSSSSAINRDNSNLSGRIKVVPKPQSNSCKLNDILRILINLTLFYFNLI